MRVLGVLVGQHVMYAYFPHGILALWSLCLVFCFQIVMLLSPDIRPGQFADVCADTCADTCAKDMRDVGADMWTHMSCGHD